MIYLGKNKIGGNATDNSSLPEVTSADNGDLLTVVDGVWAKGEPGYRVENNETVIAAEQSVTTVDDNGYVCGHITATWPSEYPESITVTFNGTEYTLPKSTFDTWTGTAYGEYDSDEMPVFTNYPCCVEIADGTLLATEALGTYTVKVAVESKEVVPTENFRSAVKACGAPGYDVNEVAGTEIVPEQSVTAATVGTSETAAAEIGPLSWNPPEGYPENVVVVIDGTQYALEKTSESGGVIQYDGSGGIALSYVAMDTSFTVEMPASMAGTHTISVSEPGTRDVVPSEDFKLAVNNSYMVPSEVDVVPEQTVEATDQGGYVAANLTNVVLPSTPPETLRVTLNGTVYEASYRGDGDGSFYGDRTYQAVPFMIALFVDMAQLYVPESGSYTVQATGEVESVNPKFKEAVKQSGGGMPTVMFEVYYDDSGEHTPEHLIITCNKTNDELIAAEGPLFAQALLWQTNPPFNAIASMMESDDGGNTYAEFQFLTIVYESSHEELALTIIKWNGVEEKWAVEFHEFGLTPLT